VATRVWKRAIDIVGSLVLLLVLMPLMLVLAGAIRLTSHGPALYWQHRAGCRGNWFRMAKFRTMLPDAEQHLQVDPTLSSEIQLGIKPRNDPRITTLGRDLRAMSLDEVPQLWNVLKGDMSLVGPRPLSLASELAWYGDHVDRLLSVRPGMTGLWQVSGRSDLSVEERVRLDLEYVENVSFLTDLSILLRTTKVVLFPRGNGAY
jgi:lipopolysaccharide/colanic/teichoic acid biosynthesis glycosyltransferase